MHEKLLSPVIKTIAPQQPTPATRIGGNAAVWLSAMNSINYYEDISQAAHILMTQHNSRTSDASLQHILTQISLVETLNPTTTSIKSTSIDRLSIDVYIWSEIELNTNH